MATRTFSIRIANIWQVLSYMLFGNLVRYFLPVSANPDKAALTIKPNEFRVWMIGHSTVLINLYGTTILTDPVLVNTIPFPKRLVRAAYAHDELPKIDLIIVSHAHFDHLNRPTLKSLAAKTQCIVVPKNCGDLVSGLGFERVEEMDWGQSITIQDIRLTAYQPEHWGQRVPWERVKRSYNSYVLEHQKTGKEIFFCGDSGYGDFFKLIGGKHKIDFAMLPIGAYNPPAFRRHHMDPNDALRAFEDLGARSMVPIHWGSFRLSLEPMNEPVNKLRLLAAEKNVGEATRILHNGESAELL